MPPSPTSSNISATPTTFDLSIAHSSKPPSWYQASATAAAVTTTHMPSPILHAQSHRDMGISVKRKNAKEATSVGGSTAVARSLMMQGLYLFYRTPVKLFRPLRIDYLVMARALLPPIDEASSKRFWFRYTSIGMISNAVKKHGWSFIPRHILPPLLANTMIGTVLYTTYIATLPLFHPTSAFQLHRPFPPPPFVSVFMAGCLAGAVQSIVASPLDSCKIRFQVSDLIEGRHRSMYQFAKATLKDLGIASAYRGFTLTLVRDSLACGLFFATFEWVKQQGYYYFLDEIYGVHVDSTKTLHEIEEFREEQTDDSTGSVKPFIKERPPLMLEPIFVILAGAAAAVAYQIIEHPLSKIHSMFYIEEGRSEFDKKSERVPVNELYRRTWEKCRDRVRKLHNGSWRHFLYQEFGGTVLKVVPATSIGFLVFELVKREVDFRSIDWDNHDA